MPTRPPHTRPSLIAATLMAAALAPAASAQLHTLGAPAAPRFAITDRVWPAAVGQADIALWQDDKLGAISFTIDDNAQPDHQWWIDRGNQYNTNFTWFVITDRVSGGNNFFGTWADFAALRAEGHDVQSHSVTHLGPGYTGNIADEYAPSIQAIEANLPGHTVTTLAYPNGLNPNNDNDAALAGQIFTAVRGVTGTINRANTINYNNTNSIGAVGINKHNWTQMSDLLNPNSPNFRGWYVSHAHLLNANDPTEKDTVIAGMDYAQTHQDDLWVGLFRDVAHYGMQRDTATLTSQPDGNGGFTLNLTDQMDDAFFQLPLTVKLRVPDDWTTANVTQNGNALAADIIQHNGATFALVPVIPDAGDALVSSGGIVGDFNNSGQVEQGDLDLVLQNWGDDTSVTGAPAGWTNDNTDLGQIEQTELDRVLQNWGSTAAPDFRGTALPEPTTAALFLMLGLLPTR